MNDRTCAWYWLAAARSGFASSEQWKSWADRRIEEADIPDEWLIDVSLAKDLETLTHIITSRFGNEEEEASKARTVDTVLGYLWLRYERGDYDLAECLRKAGEYADNWDTSIECEVFYALLSDLEAGSTNLGTRRMIEEQAESRFTELREMACGHWELLMGSNKP